MEKHKEVFFTIRLHSAQSAASLNPIQDPDPLMPCDLMDGRDAFLTMARERHLEFSSLRRVKYSTMALLYELHTQVRIIMRLLESLESIGFDLIQPLKSINR